MPSSMATRAGCADGRAIVAWASKWASAQPIPKTAHAARAAASTTATAMPCAKSRTVEPGSRSMNATAKAAARMDVPLLDLKGQYQALKAEILPVIEKVCASQHFILGAYVRELEQRVAKYSQTAHGI